MNLVSILIPYYNGSNFIEKSLSSAVNQSYSNVEIIIINDCSSTTETKLLLKKIKKFKKKNIFYIENKTNMGVAYSLNKGIKKSKGEYISWLSHDDEYEKDKISNQILYATKKNIVYCNHKLIDHHGNFIKNINVDKFKLIRQDRWMLFDDRLNGCSLLIPKNILIKEGLFDEKLKHIQDYDMWYKLSKKYKFLNCKKYLVKSRIHKNQDSHKKSKEAFNEKKKFYTKQISLIAKKNFFIAFIIYTSNKIRGNI